MKWADICLAILIAAIVTAAYAAYLVPATRGVFPLGPFTLEGSSHEHSQNDARRP
jgi:hypothetical protein